MVRSGHAHASYPGLFFRTPGFSPYMGREERRVQGLDYQNSDLGLEDLDKLEAKGQAENTKRATSWGIKKFEKWCDKRKLKADFNCVTPVEITAEILR